MKTTLSVPDDVFESAERLARRMGVTRNDFYVAALRRYLRNLREMEVERILDRIGNSEKAMSAHLRA